MLQPEDLATATKEQLVKEFEVADNAKDEMEAYCKVIRDELASRMQVNAEVVNGFSLIKTTKYVFKNVTMDVARTFGAIKEAIDTVVLNKIAKSGVQIPGASSTTYLMIRNVTQK